MGSMDMLIVGGIIVIGGALLFYPDAFSNIFPPASGTTPGGEFIDPGTGGGEFIGGSGGGGEQSYEGNNQTECQRKYKGKCRDECKSTAYGTAECADCLALCGSKAYGCRPGYCWSYGLKQCRVCGSTSPAALTAQCKKDYGTAFCWSLGAKSCVRCGSTGPPKQTNPSTYPRPAPGQPANCVQVSATSYKWVSSGKTGSTAGSCTQARSNWLRQYSTNTRPAEPVKKTKTCSTPDRCNWNPGGLNKKCSCGCAGGSWNIGHNTPCSQCETACRARRRQAGYSDAAYFFEDAAESFFDDGTRFANMAMTI